jgi:Spy/CpxP family protein refolding chaperone
MAARKKALMEIVNSKWKLRVAVLAIFALGFAAGAFSLNIYRSYRFGQQFRSGQMLDRLQLTSEQRPQVEKILSDARMQIIDLRRQSEPRMREVREQTDQRLQTVLTPEQWEKFKKMRGEMGGRRFRRGGRDF